MYKVYLLWFLLSCLWSDKVLWNKKRKINSKNCKKAQKWLQIPKLIADEKHWWKFAMHFSCRRDQRAQAHAFLSIPLIIKVFKVMQQFTFFKWFSTFLSRCHVIKSFQDSASEGIFRLFYLIQCQTNFFFVSSAL